MMVETVLDSSQDFSMSNGSLPQWKRELLQRRAARSRPAVATGPAPSPAPPPPPPAADEEEELRYGPGIVKRLKSRYLSLALREAPPRRPSVLRRATSLEHLLDARPPPAPRAPRAPRLVTSVASSPAPAPVPAIRRDSVKRARSVDALSRLESCEPPPPPPPPPPPVAGRGVRPPRRPAPLLRETERPPPDVVRSTLRKFESAGGRRSAGAARVSPVVRAPEPARRSVTPERPNPAAESPPPAECPPPPPAVVVAATNPVLVARQVGVIRPMPAAPSNGPSALAAAGIERAWSGSAGPRRAPPPATSIVFNFCDRKEVPDYIENDGIILRASRRHTVKAGEPGVVVLRDSDTEGEGEEPDGGAGGRAPSPCRVRFVNDNVLINGRSSMPPRPRDPRRLAKLKLQFDDSLTRTFEYPSETSLCEESSPSPPPAPPPPPPPADPLANNTHIVSAALSRYTPTKTSAAAFQLGVTRHAPPPPPPPAPPAPLRDEEYNGRSAESGERPGHGAPGAEYPGHAVPCGADAARSWSEARSTPTDLLF